MYELGEPYNWDTWANVPVGTKCANNEFPGAVLVVAMRQDRKVLIWRGEGARPISNRRRGTNNTLDSPIDGFEPAASWTCPLLAPRVLCLPMGA